MTKSKGADILNPDHSKLKILTHKQKLQRLTIALAQVKAGNNSESLFCYQTLTFITYGKT